MTMYATLAALRDALATVTGVKTCRIGMEANMTPADYPIVRIVPSRLEIGAEMNTRGCDALIYFGLPIHEADGGLEAVYEQLFDLEAALVQKAQFGSPVYCRYLETICDEDRVDAYKLMALSVRIETAPS